MAHLLELSTNDLGRWLADRGLPRYRSDQVRRWLFTARADDFRGMTDLSRSLQKELARHFHIWSTRTVRSVRSADGTEKLVLQLEDDATIECVLLRDAVRRTFCVSTQVGCAMGCVFCASGLDGVHRNLSPGEIIEQMLRLKQRLGGDETLSHLVVMGMGEPLANLDALLPALDQVSSASGLGLSCRRITISTVGIPAAMRRLADHPRQYRLAVSLHAPNDELRNQIVPTNRNTGLSQIVAAADHYFDVSRRRLTYEYVLLAGVNDQAEHARQLARLLGRREAIVNIIPYNRVPGLPYRTPSRAAQRQFRTILTERGIRVKFRHRKGHAISAACGQLRRQTVAADGPR
ncbi:MAG: 23S rRNA (adenine(2503)-C(2))-methyltransferase RlmN [Pirellulales bacterium]